MGVRELWTVLSPVKESVPLSSLTGKTLAVDLSGWVCQAHTIGIPSAKPHLRQLFVRVFRLYREGVRLMVVLDGEAIQLKWSAMDTRAKATGRGGFHGYQRMTGQRSFLNRQIRECTELLDVLGVPHLQSVGEAEALCALLNKEGYVDGVLTQDGDAFLYGATVVYKDISVTDFTVDCYTASRVEGELGLTRRDLVSLALLVGCDYCPKGVPGVGRAAALKFIASCKPQDSLEVMKGWTTTGEGSECKVQRLSQGVLGFPSQAVIREFTTPRDTLPSRDRLDWKIPLVLETQLLCKRELEWSTESTCGKARLLLTHWVISRKGCGLEIREKGGASCSLHPICIVKNRREKKVACFEVQWSATHQLAGDASAELAKSATIEFTSIENAQMFQRAYPDLCEHFEQAKLEKKKIKKITKPKGSKCKQPSQESPSTLSQSSADDLLSPEATQSSCGTLSNEGVAIGSARVLYKEPSIDCPEQSKSSASLHSHPSPTHSISPHLSPPHSKFPLPAHSTPPHSPSVILIEPDNLPSSAESDSHEIGSSSPSSSFLVKQVPHQLTPLPSSHLHEATSSPSSHLPQVTSPSSLRFSQQVNEQLKLLGKECPSKDAPGASSPITVTISDDEEPLPLFVRLGKSPPKEKLNPVLSPPKQVRIDSYFPQKKSRSQKVKRVLTLGSKTEPILID